MKFRTSELESSSEISGAGQNIRSYQMEIMEIEISRWKSRWKSEIVKFLKSSQVNIMLKVICQYLIQNMIYRNIQKLMARYYSIQQEPRNDTN